MKFSLLIASTQAAAVVPTPNGYTMIADELVFASDLISTDGDALANMAAQNTFSADRLKNGLQQTGTFGCVATGNIEIPHQTFTVSITPTEPALTASAATIVNGYWIQDVDDFSVSPTIAETTGSTANYDLSTGTVLVSDESTDTANLTGTAAGTDLHDCCKRHYTVGITSTGLTDNGQYECPLMQTPTIASGPIIAGTPDSELVPNIVYTTNDSSVNMKINNVATGLSAGHLERNTDFYLASLFQNMADSTAADNWCIVGDGTATDLGQATTNSEITAKLIAQTGSASGNGATASAVDKNMKCTFQFYSIDDFAPSIKVEALGSINYTVQYAEWVRSSSTDIGASNVVSGVLPDKASTPKEPYLFKPNEVDVFTSIAKTYANMPGAWSPDLEIEIHAFGNEQAADTTASYTILADAAPAAIGSIPTNVWQLWNSGVAGVSEAVKSAMDDYNTDADAWNDDIADVEAAREDGKGADEDGSDDLPDRPCEPADIKYPTTSIEFSADLANTQDNAKRFQFVPYFDADGSGTNVQSTAATTMVVGNLALFNIALAGTPTYDYTKVWARKVFGRLGQAADSEGTFDQAFRTFVDADANDTAEEQWMQFSIFPDHYDLVVAEATTAAEIRVNQVAIEAFPTGFDSVSAGSGTSLDELEGAAVLAGASLAMAAVAVSLF